MELSVILGILLIIIVVIYALFTFWAYRNQRFIFSPYTPTLGPGLFQPGGDVQQLSQEQIQCRRYALGAITDSSGNPLPPPSNCFTIDPYINSPSNGNSSP